MSAENQTNAPDLRPETGEQAANPHGAVAHTQLAGLRETGEPLIKVLPAGVPLGRQPDAEQKPSTNAADYSGGDF